MGAGRMTVTPPRRARCIIRQRVPTCAGHTPGWGAVTARRLRKSSVHVHTAHVFPMWADAVPTNINLLRSKTQFGYFISKIHRVSSGYKFK